MLAICIGGALTLSSMPIYGKKDPQKGKNVVVKNKKMMHVNKTQKYKKNVQTDKCDEILPTYNNLR